MVATSRLQSNIQPPVELADFGEGWGRLVTLFTQTIPEFYGKWSTDWKPGRLFVLIVTEGLVPLAENIIRTAFHWAENGPEIIGRYLDQTFAYAEDAKQSEKALTVISGAIDVLMDFTQTPFGQAMIQSATASAGIPPLVSNAVRGLLSEGWNAQKPYARDTGYEVAFNRGDADVALEELWEKRKARFLDHLELADIAAPRGRIIAIEQGEPGEPDVELPAVEGILKTSSVILPPPAQELEPISGVQEVGPASEEPGAMFAVAAIVGLALYFGMRS